MPQDMKQFLTDFRTARGWALKEMAAKLGYSSATSLVRLEQEKANLESILRFARLMHQTEAMQLTDEEGRALDLLLEKRQLTDDAYHATVLLHSLLRNETLEDQPVYVRDIPTGEVMRLRDHVADKHLTRLTMLNCLDIPFFNGLAKVLTDHNASMDHYLAVSSDASSTVQRVLRLLPLTYRSTYNAYTRILPPNQPSGLLHADMLFCEYEQHGAIHTIVMVANSIDRFDAYSVDLPLEEMLINVIPQPEAFTPFGNNRLRQARDYNEYLQLCFAMERDHEVLRIKPDFGLDQIPSDVLLNAVLDQMQQLPEAQQALSNDLDALVALTTERYHNYCTKHQAQYHVYKKQAMWRFVKTGQLSDHAWMMRPFTIQERIRVLQGTIDALRQNPYLHITFLKNENDFRNDEIIYYEGTGVSIIKPRTDYNLQDIHRESLISQEKFMHVYRAYFLNSIIGMHTLSEPQSLSELTAMVAYLSEQR